jgi:dCTP deaminase
MILTGSAITDAVEHGDITIEPFVEANVNPNSYNYQLGPELYHLEGGDPVRHQRLEPLDGRYLLRKGNFYLGHTYERIGSDKYVTSLIGRSSVGRLGLFVQLSADLGHQGAIHQWTLELFPALDIYVQPGQIIGQVSFWASQGEPLCYEGWYGHHDRPMPSKLHTAGSGGLR